MTEDEHHTVVELVTEDGTVLHSYSYGDPTPEAIALQAEVMKVIEEQARLAAAAGKVPDLKDVISVLTGVLGGFIAGIEDDKARASVYSQCGVLLGIAIDMARRTGLAQRVTTIDRSKVQ